jgi:acyl-CoA reductase-like NAD-dependent aldehyde dehydrogenase
MREIKLFINGEFITTSNTTETNDSATGEAIGTVYLPGTAEVNQAVDAAEAAFANPAWRNMTKDDRANLLFAISDKIKERKRELIELEIKDSGSTLRKAMADVHNAASYFKVLGKQLQNFEFEAKDDRASRDDFSENFRQFVPIGVCAQIIPWNFPLVMAAWKIGPIIASGCTTVLKSALETPVTASILAEIIKDAGVPAGVVNIITGDGDVGAQLVNHPKVKKVAFTGSTEVGRKIMSAASKSLKTLSLELGGKSANIVMDDADMDIAIDGALYAFLYHSGQACDSGTRLLVHEKIYDDFVAKLTDRMDKIAIGVPESKETGFGPVINKKQHDRIMNYIDTTKDEGAKLLYGGERVTGGEFDKGYYIKPTAFEITPDNTIWHEEIFGPVVGITKFKNEDEAIELANKSIYGLAGAVWSKDEARARKIANQINAGTVWINEYHLLNPGMPFGGFCQSGLGREMGPEGLKAYLEVKHIWRSDCNDRSAKQWFDAIF